MDQASADDWGHVKVMAGIGGVCVQWALLEHLVLGLIGHIEAEDLDKVYLVFGSLDMKPRLDMAILLARHHKVPEEYVRIIANVRKALQDERLSDRRNQAVHGVHKELEGDSINLTMPRWKGNRRTERVSAQDLGRLAIRLQELQKEIIRSGDEIFNWKMRVANNRLEHLKREAEVTSTPIVAKITRNLYSRAKNLWSKK